MEIHQSKEIISLATALVSLFAAVIAANKNLTVAIIFCILLLLILTYYAFLKLKPKHNFKLLTQKTVLNIQDKAGNIVHYEKHITAVTLKNNVKTYTNSLCVDGEILDIETDFGKIIKKEPELGKLKLVTAFDNYLQKNVTINRKLTCTFKDSFKNENEYWVINQAYPAKFLEIKIVFPKDRPVINYGLFERNGFKEKKTTVQPILHENEGNKILHLQISNLKVDKEFILRWQW